MAPKRSGKKKKKKVLGTLLRSSKRVIEETVKISVIQGDTQESTLENQNGDEEVPEKELLIRTIPVEERVEEKGQKIEVSIGRSKEDVHVSRDGSRKEQSSEEERSQEKKQTPTEQEPTKTRRTKQRTHEEKGQEKKKKRRRRRRGTEAGGEGYKRYVFRVMKQVHPELKISSMAMSVINSLMKDMFERIADEAAKLSQHSQKVTISSREIQDAVKLVLPGELGRHAIAEGCKAITNYMSYEQKGSKTQH